MPALKTGNVVFYLKILELLRKRVMINRLRVHNKWTFHHDNAMAHTILLVRVSLVQTNITVPSPVKSWLWHLDVFLSPKVEKDHKGHFYGTVANILDAEVCIASPKKHSDNVLNSGENAVFDVSMPKSRASRNINVICILICCVFIYYFFLVTFGTGHVQFKHLRMFSD